MTDAPMTPEPVQAAAIRRIIMEPTRAALIAAQTGTGKTLVAVEAFRMLGHKRVMISAPLHTFDGWERTIKRQIPGTEVYRLNNNTKAGREALARLKWGADGYYLVSRDFWRLQNWSDVPELDGMIHDECHTLANRKNAGSRIATNRQKGNVKYKWILAMSATPWGGSFAGAWAIGRMLWGDLIDRVPVRWEAEWCRAVLDPYALNAKKQAEKRGDPKAQHMTVSKVVGERNPGEFVRSLPCYVYFESADKQPRPIDIRVDLSRAQRKLYDDFEKKGVVWLEEHPMVATIPIVKRIRLRQLTLGEGIITPTGTYDEDGIERDTLDFREDCKSTKLDTLQELLENEALGEKVLIATDSKKFAKVVAKRIGGYAWTGDETQKARELAKEQFIDGDLPYIVATQASISEGTDGLQYASHIMVVLSDNDSDMLNTQMLGRLARRGQDKKVLVYRIIAENTYDDPQSKTLLTKMLERRASIRIEGQVVNA